MPTEEQLQGSLFSAQHLLSYFLLIWVLHLVICCIITCVHWTHHLHALKTVCLSGAGRTLTSSPLTVEVLKKFFILEMWNSAKDRLSILHQGCFEESKVDCGAERNPDQLPTSSSLDSSSSYFPVSLSSIYQ